MKRIIIAMISLLVVTTCTVGAPAAQTTYHFVADFDAIVAQPPPAYGTNLWWTDEEAALWASRWAELGPSLVRVPILHAAVEPVNDNDDPNVINWDGFLLDTPVSVPSIGLTATYGTWFLALRDQPTLNILIYFPYLAPWLSDNAPQPGLPFEIAPHPPNDLAEYREFVEAVLRYLVETLDFPPERIGVEAMNEPDLPCGADPVVACFWENWTMDDIAAVVNVTHEAILSVNAEISLVGLAECCGTSVVRDLLDNYSEGAYLDGLSYHYYSPSGYNLNTALSRASALAPYSRPIYLDEYGSRQYLSEGVDGALWHSWALMTLWEADIAPLQYPISEWPLLGEPYNSMGLFRDWRGDWERKPSYWVYTNFFRFVGDGEVISHTAPSGVDVLTTRRIVTDEVQATFWAVNRGGTALADQLFAVYNFPQQEATLRVYDNLIGPAPVLTETVSGAPLVFTATLPAYSSYAFVLSGAELHGALDHVVLAPDSGTRLAGQTISYTLTAYDADTNDWDVTASGTYTITPDAGGSWAGNVYTTEIAGTWTVTGSYSGQSDTASLTVNHASLDHVDLTPATATRLAGQSISYTLTAYDVYGNDWDVTVSAPYTIEQGAGGSWTGNVYTTEVPGTWTVTGTYGSQSDTATLTVWMETIYTYLPLILREDSRFEETAASRWGLPGRLPARRLDGCARRGG